MPAYVGTVNLLSVGNSGVFHIGDSYEIAPKSYAKTYSGAGSFNTGDVLNIKNNYSNTNTYDRDLIDQPSTFDN